MPALALFGAAALFGQADVATASLKGTITDPTQAAIPGAAVTARSTEKGVTRAATTDAQGVFQLQFLPPGAWELRVEANGFETQVSRNIQLTVGQIAVVNFELRVGAVSNEVLVDAAAPLVETERTQQSNTIEPTQIQNLPNVSRDFRTYVFTLPGVSSSNAPRAQFTGFVFRSSGFSIGGSNGRNNLITIDGGENEFGDGEPRMVNLSVEAIQEYQVNRNAFAAEFGFTSGTAVNVVTRSGTNQIHGSAYVFYRSQHTSGRNFFDFGPTKAFDQQVYPGATLGGPLAKNKLFYFLSYEAIKSDTARFRRYTDPSAIGPTANQESYLSRLGSSSDPNLQRVASDLRAALTATSYPATMELLTRNEGNVNAPVRSHTLSARLDYQAGANDYLTGRFTFSRVEESMLPPSNLIAPSNSTNLSGRDYTTVISETHNLRANLINQARVQFAPRVSAVVKSADPSSSELVIPGLATFGRSYTAPFETYENRYQFEDTLSWIKGKHFFKFGASWRPVDYRVVNQLWFGGQWTFTSGFYSLLFAVPQAERSAFINFNRSIGVPDVGPTAAALNALQSFNVGMPFLFRQAFGNPEWSDWAHFLGAFAQDSWKITRRFSLDYGVRFDFDREPAPLSTYRHFSPRLGIAWDPFGDQKTVIRAGSGIFYAPVYYQVAYLTNLLDDSGRYINQVFRTPLNGLQYPPAEWAYALSLGKAPFGSFTEQDLNSFGISTGPRSPGRVVFGADPNYNNTYSIQASAGITRQIVPNLSLDVAYQRYKGVHLSTDHEVNYKESGRSAGPGLGPYLVPINPNIVQFNQYSSIGNSSYNGLTVSLTKRFAAYSQFQINYTFSKTIDDVTDFNSQFAAFLPTNLRLERGLSAFDIRHNFVANAVLISPTKPGAGHSILSRVFAGVAFSPIVFLRSGIPFTLRTGSDINGDTHDVYDRPFYAPRNSGIGASFHSVDLRLTKPFFFSHDAKFHAQFIAEATNLFNHTNFLAVNDVVGLDPKFLFGPYNLRGSRDIPETAPLGFTAAGDPRRIQFGLKLVF